MSQEVQLIESIFSQELKKNIRLTIIVGTILLLVGLLAMGSPLVAGLCLAVLFQLYWES